MLFPFVMCAGAVGAQWLGAFKGYIEDPVTLML